MDELESILIKGVFVFMACYVLNNNVDYYGRPLVADAGALFCRTISVMTEYLEAG